MSDGRPRYVIDLHAHFPMQFDPYAQDVRRSMLHKRRHLGVEKLHHKLAFMILEFASKFWNREYPWDGPAVTIESLVQGNVGVALSAAYYPFAELDVHEPYGSLPLNSYFATLRRLVQVVEREVAADDRARVVRSWPELVAARAEGKIAMIHAVEGGFHVGGTLDGITEHVAELARFGVGYVTVAHLFYRQLSTNVAALPFLPDAVYHALFRQPSVGLDDFGRHMIRQMIASGILVDVTHMSKRGMADTFELFDEVDPSKTVPLIASHVACSLGRYEYNLEREWVERVASRGGVCGIIYCDHYVRDGRFDETRTFDETFTLITEQVEKLIEWGGEDVLAIGSDLDGFIKPTLAGLDSAADHAALSARLEGRFGRKLAEKIAHGNAMRVLEKAWMRPFPYVRATSTPHVGATA